MKEVKRKKKKHEVSEQQKREQMEILQESREVVGKQLRIDLGKGNLVEINEINELIDKKIEDPEKKFELFYNGIQKVLLKFLPKGKAFKQERRFIHDEKLIFLNRGKPRKPDGRRGSDSRQAYNEDMGEMVKLVSNWAVTSQDPQDLYHRLRALNDKHGFGHQDYDDTSKSFHKAMARISKAPKPNN